MKQRQSKAYFIIKSKNLLQDAIVLLPLTHIINAWLHKPIIASSVVILFFIYSILSTILEYINTSYYIYNKNLILSYGKLEQHTLEINQQKGILNYRKEQDWIQRLLNVYGMIIFFKNGEEQSEIKFIALTDNELKKIEESLPNKSQDLESSRNKSIPGINITTRKICLTGLLSANYLLIIPFLLDLNDFRQWLKSALNISIQIDNFVIVVLILMIPFFTVVVQYFNYARFNIINANDEFIIHNGLINTDENILLKSDIAGIVVDRNIGLRLLRLCSVSAILNNESSESSATKNFIFPLISETKKMDLINEYLPNYKNIDSDLRHHWTVTKIILLIIGLLIGIFSVVLLFKFFNFIVVIIFLLIYPIFIRPLRTTIKFNDQNEFIEIKDGFINQKLYYIPYAFVGVNKSSNIGRIINVISVFTDRNPTNKFTEIK